jgi:predicted RNase H-like nuclease (RuvC/YqgF family)
MYNLNNKKKIVMAALLCSLTLVLFLSGCENPGQTSSQATSKHKLIASKNKKLQQNLKQAREEIDQLKQKLAAYQKKNDALKAKANKDIQEQIQPLIGTIMDQHSKLKEENKQLKAKLEKLQQFKDECPAAKAGKECPMKKEMNKEKSSDEKSECKIEKSNSNCPMHEKNGCTAKKEDRNCKS